MDNILKAINDFILQFTDCNQSMLFRGFQNRAALPADQNFVIYNIAGIKRVGTNITRYAKAEQNIMQNSSAKEVMVDIDFCNKDNIIARERADIIETLSRSYSAVDFFAKLNIGLLYAGEVQALPFVDDSKQYIHRYRITLHLYTLTTVETTQDYFDKTEIGKTHGVPYFENVDVEHPPE